MQKITCRGQHLSKNVKISFLRELHQGAQYVTACEHHYTTDFDLLGKN